MINQPSTIMNFRQNADLSTTRPSFAERAMGVLLAIAIGIVLAALAVVWVS